MSRVRYTIEITNAPSAFRALENILSQKGFVKQIIDSEPVYVKGSGKLQCISVCFGSSAVVLEGWIYDNEFGESAPGEYGGVILRKNLTDTVSTALTAIQCAGNGAI